MAAQVPIYRLSLDSGPPFCGFPIGIEVPGWILLNHWNGELVLNGYILVPEDIILSTTEEDDDGVHTRLHKALGIEPENPDLSGGIMKELLESVTSRWPVLCIYRREYGLSDLDVGWVREIGEDHFTYLNIAPNGDLSPEPVSVSYTEILKLGFGASYETMLTKLVVHTGAPQT